MFQMRLKFWQLTNEDLSNKIIWFLLHPVRFLDLMEFMKWNKMQL